MTTDAGLRARALLMSDQLDIPISIGALARRLGVLPATIRDWELRYGIGPSERSGGGHRRYTRHDVDRLMAMRTLVLDGIAPSDAARSVLSGARALHAAAGPSAIRGVGIGAGGRSLPLEVQTRSSRSLARAVLALDGPSIRTILDRSIEALGVLETWDGLAVPVLQSLGAQVARGGAGIASEHLLSSQLVGALDQVTAGMTAPRNHRTILLASAPDDLHDLALHALAALLSERSVATTLLGARTPVEELIDAVVRLNPSSVLVWSSVPVPSMIVNAFELPPQRPAVRCFVGGEGWTSVPRGAVIVASLDEACGELLNAAGLA